MTMHRRTFLAASAAVAVAPAVACAETGWTPRASMSWPTQEIYCAALDGEITVAGGLVRSATGGLHINDRTAVYDARADRWSEGPRLPQPRHHPMLAAAAGRVWAFGGYDRRDGGEWTAMTDVWAIDRGVWAQVGQMPERLCETVGLSLDGQVHLITGRSPKGEENGQWNDQGDVATHLVFDAAANRWDKARPAPMARNSAAGCSWRAAARWMAAERGGWTAMIPPKTAGTPWPRSRPRRRPESRSAAASPWPRQAAGWSPSAENGSTGRAAGSSSRPGFMSRPATPGRPVRRCGRPATAWRRPAWTAWFTPS